jgi:Family of unknown function (DUF5872)
MPIILHPDLYEIAKKRADLVYSKPSAYKSMAIQKFYKQLGGRFADDHKQRNLTRWINERWIDIGHKPYPVYRPTIRVNQQTPLTIYEIDQKNLQKQIKLKQKIKGNKNLPPFMPIYPIF